MKNAKPTEVLEATQSNLQNSYKKHYINAEILALSGIVFGFVVYSLADMFLHFGSLLGFISSIIMMVSSSLFLTFLLFAALILRPMFFLHNYIQKNRLNMLIPLLDGACYNLSYLNLLLIFKACVILGMFIANKVIGLFAFNIVIICTVIAFLLFIKSLLFLAKNKLRAYK